MPTDSSVSTSISARPETTAVPESTDGTTTTTTTTTTSATTVLDRFDPACVDRSIAAATAPAVDPSLSTLGLLGAEPVVQVKLPIVRRGDTVDWSRVRVWEIAGGMLMELRPYNDGSIPLGMLVAVNADGSVRWQRCLNVAPDLVALSPGADQPEFVVGWTIYGPKGPIRRDLEVWSLSDGAISRSWNDVLADNGITGAAAGNRNLVSWGTGSALVFGPEGSRPSDGADTLLVLDLAAMAMRELPYPPLALGRPIDSVSLDVAADGRLISMDPLATIAGGRVAAVESAGGWSTNAGALDEAVGVRVDFAYGEAQSPLHAVDSQGRERWRRDDLLAPPTEGFHVAIDGDVAVVSGCAQVDLAREPPCTGRRLVGVDVRSGRTLWDRQRMWAVTVVGDGVGMVSGPYTGDPSPTQPGWTMIDLSTGRSVSNRTWTAPWRFSVGCCDEPTRVYRSGGVVFTVSADTVEMWYPEARTTPLQVVSLG